MEGLPNGIPSGGIDSTIALKAPSAADFSSNSSPSIVTIDVNGKEPSEEVIAIESDEDPDKSRSSKRIFCCPKCKFSSSWKSSLHVHLKHQHSDARPWRCHMCRKGFKLKHHLKIHLYTHSSVKPYQCNMCTYSTTSERSMRNHNFNKHAKHMATNSKAINFEQLASIVQRQKEASSSRGSSLRSTIPITFDAADDNNVGNNSTFRVGQLHTAANQSYQAGITASSNGQMSPMDVSGGRKKKSVDTEAFGSSPTMVQRSFNFSEATPSNNEHLYNGTNHSRSCSPPLIIDASPPPSDKYSPFPSSQRSNSSAREEAPGMSPASTSSRKEAREREAPSSSSPIADGGSVSLPNAEAPLINWQCEHCKIIFPDNILYALHMGCHAHSHPFECNKCGKRCNDRHDFMIHFSMGKHN